MNHDENLSRFNSWLEDVFTQALDERVQFSMLPSSIEDVLCILDTVKMVIEPKYTKTYDRFLIYKGIGSQSFLSQKLSNKDGSFREITKRDLTEFRMFWQEYLEWRSEK